MSILNWFVGNEDPSPRRGQPRRRVVPIWRRRGALIALAVVMLVAAAGGGMWTWNNGLIGRAADQAKWNLIALSGKLGFTVEDVLVVGRSQTTREELMKAVRLARGAPILAYDLEEARRRIEALPWIGSASVERMLPDTILLSVVERQPLALWQSQGRFSLIDQMGKVILNQSIEQFSDLLVVVGEDAPKNAAALLDILQTQPQLMDLAKSAVRVGQRRWNVRLRGDIDVRLPAERAAAAWSRLAEYESRHGILSRDVKVLDLRLPDRLIVRKTPNGPEIKIPPERET
ncbi:MAG: FtsQ-type POTRA domain-containing protein [Rhodospirillaceae bacterium]|nr:FtsQ-type POTRA domain-containing protein [Rhodospirillaceae bacterium]MBL6930257.1 FtsQ-type POTRA domain-containing protein [Rhodospirillales bacterium]MBL6940846.1 FtsQ-type POTRA domain-containing protein [Rhodospirillales bacterium]